MATSRPPTKLRQWPTNEKDARLRLWPTNNASAAGHLCGVRLVDDAKKVAKERRTLQKMAEMASRPSARELAAGHR